ncbi:MAG: hypothetical protein HQK77_06815 [Desulfobacterales bacterium]|nr:hypothetical protein [Desulfobacterales bacterium]
MKINDLYTDGHLVVSAIRLHEHQKGMSPSIEDVCNLLNYAQEAGNRIIQQLQQKNIIEVIESAYGNRLFIKDHLKIEDLPKKIKENSLKQDIDKFHESKKQMNEKIHLIQQQQSAKKKHLFEEIEQKLKQNLTHK